jgi:transcriptional regulator with XRE-family HTH domain
MPAQAPPTDDTATRQLGLIGARIREHRKVLGINAVNAALAAGMSRVTLHRIEAGEPSVTMGAYLNAASALGLEIGVTASEAASGGAGPLPAAIKLTDYPQLKQLAWHIPGAKTLTPEEALNLYERNWRHLDREKMALREASLLDALVQHIGKGRLLV